MNPANSRYRVEGGRPRVDVRVDTIDQLFDVHDPAPFRQRDLDPGVEQYLRDAAEDLDGRGPFHIVFWLVEAPPPGELQHAVRSHFADVLERLRRQRRVRRRTGYVALAIAAVLLVTLLSLAHLVHGRLEGAFALGLREALVIAAWVIMWRPVEALLYDWIPAWRERRTVTRALAAPIEIRVDSPKAGERGGPSRS